MVDVNVIWFDEEEAEDYLLIRAAEEKAAQQAVDQHLIPAVSPDGGRVWVF